MSTETTTEFAVNLTCQKCVLITEKILKDSPDILDFSVNLEKQRVVVTSTKSTNKVKEMIESTGKRAVVLGIGTSEARITESKYPAAAVVMVGGLIGAGKVEGVIRLVQVDAENCVIDGSIDGLNPFGEHALAIHECGDIRQGCFSVGEHFNPRNTLHGSPLKTERHVGDLGNIVANQFGRAEFKFSDRLVKVSDIIGRSMCVAERKDDLGETCNPLSPINGNCGKLLSCGIIARSSGLFQNSKRICACDGVTLWDERDTPIVGKERSKQG